MKSSVFGAHEPAMKRKNSEPLLGDVVPAGSITFHAQCVSFQQHIKRPAAGRELQVYTSTAAVCVASLLQCEGMQIEQQHSAHRQDVITVTVPRSVIRKLPVFDDLWESTVLQDQCGNVSPGNSTESTRKRSRPHTVAFTPPVVIWALVSLLLVLEDKIDLWNLFGNVDTDPKLAAHTILMSDFCGDETAGGKVRTWLYRQAMLRVATLCTSSADVSHCAPVVWHLSEVFLALPEEHMPFIDESQRKRASSAGLITTGEGPEEEGYENEGEARVSVRFALHLPPPLLNAWLRRQRRVTVDFRELQHEDGPTALVALTGMGMSIHQYERNSALNVTVITMLGCLKFRRKPPKRAGLIERQAPQVQLPASCVVMRSCMRNYESDRMISSVCPSKSMMTYEHIGATHLQELTLRGGLSQDGGTTEAHLPCTRCGKSACTFKCTTCNRSGDSAASSKGDRKQNTRLSVATIHSKCAPLTAVQACLVSLTSLRKLHLHGMPILPGDLTFLGVVARALSETLVHLTICRFDGSTCCVPTKDKARGYAPVHKELFFKTVSLFSGLQTLQMTTLLSFVQGHDLMMLAPLKSMRDLKTVIFSRQGTEESGVMALEKYAVANLNPELRLLDSPCTICT